MNIFLNKISISWYMRYSNVMESKVLSTTVFTRSGFAA